MTITRRQLILGAGSAALAAGASACGSSSSSPTTTSSTTTLPKKAAVPVPLVDRIKVGCFVQETTSQAEPVPPLLLDEFEGILGKRFDIIHYFIGWGAPFGAALNADVPLRDLMITWEPPGTVITEILDATYDAYIAEYARAAKAYDHPVYLRFAAEMNGNWNSYSSAAPNGPSAKDFRLAWHRVYGIFKAVKADKVKFVWSPTEVDTPDVAGNHMEDYWPGATYVDILAFDAYNWSTGGLVRGGGGWRTFDQMCATAYPRVAKLDKTMPIWICETGCTEAVASDPPGVTKGGWFLDMFTTTEYPRLGAVIYFSSNDASLQRDWRIDTSAEAVAGWKQGWTS
jgi:hypothetical protein